MGECSGTWSKRMAAFRQFLFLLLQDGCSSFLIALVVATVVSAVGVWLQYRRKRGRW